MTPEQVVATMDEISSSLLWLSRETAGEGFGPDHQAKLIARVTVLFQALRETLEA